MKETITSFVGLDVHKDSIAVAVAEAGRQAPRFVGTVVPRLSSGAGAPIRHPCSS
jgi:transposase